MTPGQRAWSLRGFAVQLRKAGEPESTALAVEPEKLANQSESEQAEPAGDVAYTKGGGSKWSAGSESNRCVAPVRSCSG